MLALQGIPFRPLGGHSPMSLFLHVPPKARCRAASRHLSPVMQGRGQNRNAGTNLRGQNGSAGTKWEPWGNNFRCPLPSRISQRAAGARCPAVSGHLSPVMYSRGQIRGDRMWTWGTISGIPLPLRTSQSPMPCGFLASVPVLSLRGQICPRPEARCRAIRGQNRNQGTNEGTK